VGKSTFVGMIRCPIHSCPGIIGTSMMLPGGTRLGPYEITASIVRVAWDRSTSARHQTRPFGGDQDLPPEFGVDIIRELEGTPHERVQRGRSRCMRRGGCACWKSGVCGRGTPKALRATRFPRDAAWTDTEEPLPPSLQPRSARMRRTARMSPSSGRSNSTGLATARTAR
jgi:hypothetical protein